MRIINTIRVTTVPRSRDVLREQAITDLRAVRIHVEEHRHKQNLRRMPFREAGYLVLGHSRLALTTEVSRTIGMIHGVLYYLSDFQGRLKERMSSCKHTRHLFLDMLLHPFAAGCW